MRNKPLLSAIIPTRNRAQRLGALLDSLVGQEPVSFKWEVLVVDNASSDETATVACQKSQTLPFPIRYLVEPQLGLHQGRHRGAYEARGDYLAYLDDDMLLAPTWVQGVERLARGTADAVVGRILPKWEAEPPSWLSALVKDGVYSWLGIFDLGSRAKPIDPVRVFGGNCFLPRKLIFELGGFHPDGMPSDLVRYRGDGEAGLMASFKQAGLRAYYDPVATAYHVIGPERMTREYLSKRAYNEGVSRSFTQLRAKLHQIETTSVSEGVWYYVQRVRSMPIKEIISALARRIKRLLGRLDLSPSAAIRRRMEAAFRAGWKFHQSEVKKDPELLKYVLRESYLDDVSDLPPEVED